MDKLWRQPWKNAVAGANEAYVPTAIEHVANIITHAVFIPVAVVCSSRLLASSSSAEERFAAIVYGSVLVGLFSVSTVFHMISGLTNLKWWQGLFHRCDRAMIYFFIAGSYTPWLHLKTFSPNVLAEELKDGIWLLALSGILYQIMFHERYKGVETLIYVLVGVIPGVIAVCQMDDSSGVPELRLGGLIYLVGVVFFKSDGRIPLAHAIWHLHVVAGALIHYHAVATYLISSRAH